MKIVKGKRAVSEAVKSAFAVERIMIDSTLKSKAEIKQIIKEAEKKSIKIMIVSREDLLKILPEEKNTQGIIAYVKMKNSTIDSLLDNKAINTFVVALDHIQDPYNFGAVLRTCESFGVKTVIYPKDRNCSITPGVIKASSGAIHHLNMIKVVNLAQTLIKMDKEGYWIYTADSNNGTSLDKFEPACPMVLVVGNEQKGISRRIKELAHSSIIIKTKGRTESLNVSVATSILIYELAKKIKL
ncbi:MAG: 23S rRNA (guanosine(2251)-2'-O)-methyltransferase RlmB [bacterium]|nr:23S rRNA (guanosine(2251)-2'-O)-methyltransferase RlmB [bacterium]